jgi:hypothetical protein
MREPLEYFTELPAPGGPSRPRLDVFGNPLRCGFAVFTRNHRRHLDEGVELCLGDPDRRVTFRSAKRWVAASAAVEFGVVVPVYVAAIGADSVEYEAELIDVQLDPSEDDATTIRLLDLSTPSTQGEKLWSARAGGKRVRTLYVVAELRRIPRCPVSQLRKATGGPLSRGYRYSYALVKPIGK